MDLIAKAMLFHFGYPPLMKQMYIDNGEQLKIMFAKVKSTGVTTSLDLAKPDPDSPAGQADWRKILSKTLPAVDVFIPSLEEIFFMLERDQYDRMEREFGSTMLDHVDGPLLARLSN